MSTSPIPPILDQDRYAVYQPTAATTDFALGFPLFGDAGDVAVFLDGAPLVLATDYTVRSAAKGATLTPAPVTDAFVRLNAPISAGKLEIYGNFRPRRTIQATAPYGTRDFNFSFSLLMAVLREMWSQFTRAIQAPVGEASLTLPAKAVRSGQVLGFDEAGNPIAGGRYGDLIAAAAAANADAAAANTSAGTAAAAAAAAATFNPANYVPVSLTIASGLGVLVNGGASAQLSGTITISLDLTAKALAQAVWTAGVSNVEAPISPAKLAATIAALAPAPIFTRPYKSAEQALVAGGSITLAHGLGMEPKAVIVKLICKVAENGFPVDSIVPYPTQFTTGANQGIVMRVTASNLYIVLGNYSSNPILMLNTSGILATTTPSYWRMIVEAYA